jgi:sterol desaturase/sphingolipid hydroxylase (fatty acid hydroxylase superfamily)
MPYMPTNHSDVPIRLFKSDFLEAFTHIHPAVVLILWLPIAAWHLSRPIANASLSAAQLVVAFFIGMIVWSFTEYTIHRFVFHFEPKGNHPTLQRLIFLFHGIHHVQPQIKTRLVMPPIVTIPLALIFYQLYSLIVGNLLGAPQWVDALFGGFIVGYVCYDMIHYATHHLPMRWGILKAIKRYHMLHHYKTPNERFGVSTPTWDVVFGTLPDDTPRPKPEPVA